MGALQKATDWVSEQVGTSGGGDGGVLGGIFGSGTIIPGLDNPFQSGDKTWLPGLGAANPLNSQSVVGQAVKDLGALNIYNPDSVAGKVVNNVVTDIGKDPLKWAAVAVAIAAGQPQLIPSIMSVAKLTSKPSSPEEWITEGIKAAAIQYGGEWVAQNVAGASGYVGSTDAGQDWIPGTGVAGATGSATAAKVAANAARGMFVAAAQNGTTDINGAKIITSAVTGEGLNQAMAEIPGWDTLTKSEQSTAANAFKVAFNKDSNAAYNLFNQGFDKVVKEAELQAKSLGYNDLKQQVYINDQVYSKGTAEDRALLNKTEQEYKTAAGSLEQLKRMGASQGQIDQANEELTRYRNKLDILPDDIGARTVGWDDFRDLQKASSMGVKDPAVWNDWQRVGASSADDYKTKLDWERVGATSATDYSNKVYDEGQRKLVGATDDADYETKKRRVYGDLFGTGEQVVLYMDGRIQDSNDAAPREATAEEAAFINRTFPGAIPAKETTVVDDLTKAGLHDDLDNTDLTKVVGGTDAEPTKKESNLSSAIENLKAGNEFEAINLLRKNVGLNPYTQDEYNAWKIAQANPAEGGDDTLTGGTGTNTTTGTIDDGTATGNTTKSLDGASAYKYDPAKKTYTYTSDDGSTLTLDESGTPIGFTEATDTSWTGLTDTATGKLRLPSLPGGKLPDVKPPAKKTTDTTKTTTTNTGTTTTTTNTGTTTTGTGTTTTGTGTTTTGTGTTTTGTGARSIDSILNLLEGTGGGGQQVPYAPAQIPVADIKSYYNTIRGISGERLLPESKEEKENYGIDGMFAEGGTVDDLLRILRG